MAKLTLTYTNNDGTQYSADLDIDDTKNIRQLHRELTAFLPVAGRKILEGIIAESAVINSANVVKFKKTKSSN